MKKAEKAYAGRCDVRTMTPIELNDLIKDTETRRNITMSGNRFDQIKLGGRIKYFRRAIGSTQAEIAKELSKSESTVRMWELDKSMPSLNMVVRLCYIFSITPNVLFGHGGGIDEYSGSIRYHEHYEILRGINLLLNIPDDLRTPYESGLLCGVLRSLRDAHSNTSGSFMED